VSDGASREGAALAFYATLSLAPFLLVMATVAAFFLGSDAAQGYLLRQGGALVGDQGSALLAQMLKGGVSAQAKGWAALIGIVSTLAGATAGFSELQTALNRIFVAPEPRTGILALAMTRVLSLLLVIFAGVLLVLSLALTAVVSRGLGWLGEAGHVMRIVTLVANEAVTLTIATLLFGLVLMVLPDRRVPWRLALRGGFLTAILFQIAKVAIGWYIGRAAGAAVYGAAAALVVLMLWIYFSAQVFLLGAEFAAAALQAEREQKMALAPRP
jgi:membrane protein